MTKLLQQSLFVLLTIAMSACTSVEDPPGGGGTGGSAGTGGTAGTAGTGGTSGTGGSSGTGGTGGTNASPTVTLTATPISVANGTIALVSWDVTNATSCDAQGDDWDGTRLADGGPEERFIYKDSRFELLCTGPGGTGSDEVDVSLNSSQLLVSVDMNFYLVKAGDNFDVDVTVSNPGAQMVQNVFVSLIIPQYVIINEAALPSNASCTGACDAGEMIEWDIGGVGAGTVTVVSVEPEVSLTVPDAEDIQFEVTTSADGEPDEVVTENTTEGDSDLGLGLAQTPSEPEAGDTIVYTLSYDNSGPSPLANVELTLTLPGPVAFVSANNGGTVSDGVITWAFTELAAGANGDLEATVEVNPTIPPGAQLRAAAGASVDGTPVRARATTLGSVGDGMAECQLNEDCSVGDFCVDGECTPPLLAEVSVDADPVVEGELFGVSVTVTNPTRTETVNGVEVQVPVPPGVTSISAERISRGGTCNVSSCAVGRNITWQIGSLAPGESRVVSLVPTAAAGSAGSPISFTASAASSSHKSANGQATVGVVMARALNLRMVESANPVAVGQDLTYTLHYANQSNSTINGVELMLTTPTDGSTVTDAGGGTNTQGVIVWDLGQLEPGEGGTRTAVVTVNAATGKQLRADAVVFDVSEPTEQARATVQTPVADSPLIAFVEVNPDPSRQGELTSVSVTVTNPSTNVTRNNVAVQVRVPPGVTSIPSGQISSGGTCNVSSCAVGKNITWQIGSLAPGESRVVSLAPTIAGGAVNGSVILFEADVREDALTTASAVEQTSVLAGAAMIVRGTRALNLRMVESANPVAVGQVLTYTLHYANHSNSTINNVELRLTAPTDGSTVTDTGGGTNTQGVISWNLGQLNPGEGGTRTAQVTVNAAAGSQLRAEAVVFDVGDPNEQTRATVQTPIADSPLIAFVEVNPDPSRQGELTNVSVTVTNPSTNVTRNNVAVQVRVPQGVTSISTTRISSGGTCNVSSCAVGKIIGWQIGSLAPGESRVVSLEPIIGGTTVDGAVILFEADVREDALTSATAVEQTTVLAGAAMIVRGTRALNLRMVESANPIAVGQDLTYTLHYANQSNSTINNVELRLTAPTDGSTVSDTGGGTNAQGVISWNLGQLNSGEGGTRTAVVTVNAAAGQQLRAEALVSDMGDVSEQTRATVQTPVGDSTLATTVLASADPVQPGDLVRITFTVDNVSASVTENLVTLQLQVPQGLVSVPSGSISGGGTCNVSSCAIGKSITWDIGSLIPGESTGMDLWIDPTVLSGAPPGFLLYFESETSVGDEPRVVAGTTVAVEPAP